MASDDQVESPCDDRSRAPSILRRPIAAAATTAGTVTAKKMLMSKRHPRDHSPDSRRPRLREGLVASLVVTGRLSAGLPRR